MKEQIASQQLSDSELSLQLSDASTLSSESEPEDAHNDRRFSDTKSVGKTTTKKQSTNSKKNSNRRRSSTEEKLYCICRKGYDGEEFMIACDGCQEWFHGRCVGVKPKSVTGHYFCEACTKAKSRKPATKATNSKGRKGKTKRKPKKQQQPPSPPPPPPPPPSIPEHATISLSCEEEDLDDICPVCDTECTCGAEVKPSNDNNLVATDPWEVTDEKVVVERVGVEDDDEPQQQQEQPPQQQQQQQSSDDVDIDISDQDYLLDDGKSTTYTSSIHIDSGDDEGLEREEEEAIIRDMMEHGSDHSADIDSEDEDEDDEDEVYYYADDTDNGEDDQETQDPEPSYSMYLGNGWSTSEEEEEEEDLDEMEYDEEDDEEEAKDQLEALPVGPDDQKKLFDSIAAAFMEILAPLSETTAPAGDGSSSNVDMASLLGITPMDQHHGDMNRRLSLPSSAVSAAAQDHPGDLTSEALGAMSALESELPLPPAKDESVVVPALPFSHDPTAIQYDLKLQEQLLDLVNKRSNATTARHIMPKTPESTETSDKKRSLPDSSTKGKKPRLSSPPSSPTESEPPVIPVSMDELVDTSQLYTRSSSRSPSPELDHLDTQLSRDLSRWQRVPIGAFRLMRSKNKLWLER